MPLMCARDMLNVPANPEDPRSLNVQWLALFWTKQFGMAIKCGPARVPRLKYPVLGRNYPMLGVRKKPSSVRH